MTNKKTTVKEDIAAAMLFSLMNEIEPEAEMHIDKLISIVLMQQKAIDVLMTELHLRS